MPCFFCTLHLLLYFASFVACIFLSTLHLLLYVASSSLSCFFLASSPCHLKLAPLGGRYLTRKPKRQSFSASAANPGCAIQLATTVAVVEKKGKEHTFRRQFNEKPNIVPGRPVAAVVQVFVGRIAMIGFAAAIVGEVQTGGKGPLGQLALPIHTPIGSQLAGGPARHDLTLPSGTSWFTCHELTCGLDVCICLLQYIHVLLQDLNMQAVQILWGYPVIESLLQTVLSLPWLPRLPWLP